MDGSKKSQILTQICVVKARFLNYHKNACFWINEYNIQASRKEIEVHTRIFILILVSKQYGRIVQEVTPTRS
jgi:hypothetical protein